MAELKITPGPWVWDENCLVSGQDEVLSDVWFPGPERFIGPYDPADVCLLDSRNGANSKAIAAVPLYEDLRKAENELQAAIAEARERPLDQSKRDLVSGKKVAVSKALEALNAALEVNGG